MENPFGSAEIADSQACLWFLGQAGYFLNSCGTTVVIDPYLSDSASRHTPELARLLPVPVEPQELRADVFIVTHAHDDHLDPETVGPYQHKETTTFVAPRFAAAKLPDFDVPAGNIVRIDTGERKTVRGIEITGVYAVPNDPAAIDTAGYRLEFPNGRSVYHSSDTGMSDVLLRAVPQAEVLLVCINGKWGNLGPAEAARLAAAVRPAVAIPNHYDMMAVNTENPAAFAFHMKRHAADIAVRILDIMESFVW